MEWTTSGDDVFLRLDPGEEIHASLQALAEKIDLNAAAVTSGMPLFHCSFGCARMFSVMGSATYAGPRSRPSRLVPKMFVPCATCT